MTDINASDIDLPIMPRARVEAPVVPPSSERKDPILRGILGMPQNGVQLRNKDPNRYYVLVHMAGGGGMEMLSPAMYQECGWVIEKYSRDGVAFVGGEPGNEGDAMTRYGHVLMSIQKSIKDEMVAYQQAQLDPIEKQIRSPEFALRKGREALRQSRVNTQDTTYMSVSNAGGDDWSGPADSAD